ncbi:proton-conducting transporter membrane subunit, partial [Citricoccus nitrophenolicus]
ELKQLLAASTVAQLGFVVLAAGVGAVSGGAAHLVAHASVKALLFLAAGAWLTALGTEEIAKLRGVARRWPVVGVAATVAALALAGVAPLSLWATKDAVLTAALEASPWLYAAGLVAAALSAAYAGKILWAIWRRRTHTEVRAEGTGKVSALEQAPLVVLAVAAAVLGVLALPPLSRILTDALGGHGEVSVAELAVSAGIAAAVVLLMLRLPAPEPGWALGWLGLETAAHAVIVRPSLALARALARFDDRVLDRAVNALAGTMPVLARAASRADDDGVDRGVAVIAGRVRRLGQLARVPQTGAVHQYFLQTVAVLAVGAVIWSVYAVMG